MINRKLTKQTIEAITPGDKDLIQWDSEIRGFGLKVTPRGKRSFVLFYRTLDHTQRKPTIGHYPVLNPNVARSIALDMLAQVRAGGDPSASRKALRAGRGQGTVTEWVDDYLQAKSELRTIGEIERIFRKDILPVIGKQKVEDVKRSDVTKLLAKIEGRAPVLAQQARAHLSGFYSWAMPDLPDAAVNPLVGTRRPTGSEPRQRTLTEDEIKSLWAVLVTEPDKWRLPLTLMLLTGQRRGEVLEADWREIKLGSAEWVIPADRTKNKRIHTVPLSPWVVELLETIPHRSGRLFSGVSQMSRSAKRIRHKMEELASMPVEPWVWHDIRRTVATGLQRLKVKLEVTEAILNHKSGSGSGIVGVYQTHSWAPEKRQALEKWSREVARIVGWQLTK